MMVPFHRSKIQYRAYRSHADPRVGGNKSTVFLPAQTALELWK